MTAPASASTSSWRAAAPSPELRLREDELQRLRRCMRKAAEFVHDDQHDLDARRTLAKLLEIPAPTSRVTTRRVTRWLARAHRASCSRLRSFAQDQENGQDD